LSSVTQICPTSVLRVFKVFGGDTLHIFELLFELLPLHLLEVHEIGADIVAPEVGDGEPEGAQDATCLWHEDGLHAELFG
jgi:hypothetical protein